MRHKLSDTKIVCSGLLLLLGLTQAAAAQLGSASYTIPALILPSGGATEMESTNYKLMDSKGQPAAGEISSTGYVMQIGGVYALAGMPTIPGVPIGTVPLSIEVSGQDIKLSWPAIFVRPYIYILTGDGSGKYHNSVGWTEAPRWSFAPGDPQPTGWDYFNADTYYVLHKGQVGNASVPNVTNHPEAYYKALVSKDVSKIPDAWAVGKVNIDLTAGKFTLINIPFIMTNADGSLKTVSQAVASEMPDGLFLYMATSLLQINIAGGAPDKDVPLNLSDGYWFRSNNNNVATFVGKVNSEAFSRKLSNRWNLLGFPFPRQVNVNVGEIGITPVKDDLLLTTGALGLVQYYYDGTAWDVIDIMLKAKQGFWYYNPLTGDRFFEASP